MPEFAVDQIRPALDQIEQAGADMDPVEAARLTLRESSILGLTRSLPIDAGDDALRQTALQRLGVPPTFASHRAVSTLYAKVISSIPPTS